MGCTRPKDPATEQRAGPSPKAAKLYLEVKIMQIQRLLHISLFLCLVLTGNAMGQKDKPAKPEAQDAAPAVPAAVPAVPPAAAPAAPTIDFSAPVNAGTTFKITGSKGTVSASVYLLPAGAVGCSLAQTLDPKATELSLVPDTAKPETTAPQVSVDPSTGPSITLAAPVSAGTALCLAAYSVSDPETPIYSQLAPVSAAAPAPSIGFGGTLLTDGDTIAVAGTSGHNITVYVFAPKYTPLSKSKDANGASLCIQADVQSGPQKLAFKNAGAGAPLTSAALTSALTALQLENPLTSGSSLCIADTTAAKLSSFGVVQDPKAATVVAAAAPEFAGTPSTGSTSIVVSGTLGDVISVYQLDSTASGDCGTLLKTSSPVLVQINTGTAATPALSNSTTLSGTPPFTVNLANPPASSTQLCLKQTDAKGASPQYSALMKVSDANNPYPFVRTFYTAGAMINNQNGANGSSSGAEYLDLGLTFTLPPESRSGHRPGLNTSISGRFSAIPVAAPSSSTPAGSSGTPASNPGTLNILSSQESARVLGSVSFPFRTWRTQDSIDGFFTAPLLKAGFDTLLNPSATASTGASGSATVNTATFAPVYWEYSSGLRMGYRQYPSGNDATPRTVTQVDITIGKYSNLQSLVCGTQSTTVTSAPTNTSCYKTVVAANPSATPPVVGQYTLFAQNRTNLYRLEVGGFFLFPGTPFVLGIDANLPQSALAPKNLDIQNKAGGNVAIYFGVSGNLTTLFKNLKLAGSPQ